MVKKYVFGEPFETEAVTIPVEKEAGVPEVGTIEIENGFAYGFYFDGTGYNVCTQYTKEQISLEYEYGQVYATVYGYRYNLDIYQKQQDSIIYVENNEGNGIVSCTVINTKEDLKNYYIDFAKSYVIVDLNGNTVELEQIVDGEIYYVYLQSAQI